MLRQPAVADRFYNGTPTGLHHALSNLIPAKSDKITAKAVLAPHAGYVYSGGVAGETFSKINIPETVILLGPNHHGHGMPLAVGTQDWEMPLGQVPLAQELAQNLLSSSALFTADDKAHRDEHSLEVQIPFLQYLQKDLQILPIVASWLSLRQCHEAATELARALRSLKRPALLVASTDMTHYLSRSQASEQDHLALEHILKLDADGLYDTVCSRRISMCGIISTTIALLTVVALGAEQAELVRYTDSGEVSGDTEQVVGYAGVVIR
ncbi:MAG: AmmeMemoRadiSam system protein B [Candidatus Electrothrix aestuarii]|uniref:MEMO1 family protein Q3M24_00570 n=1 Tax=Candidatus Electrothrix aestuarii TaxID=3062594 RepID=A0AAU8LWM8_9BACT|nr:AmmeMemoRadiSam system protein B [Candidatus Electrothrix aestuarii]